MIYLSAPRRLISLGWPGRAEVARRPALAPPLKNNTSGSGFFFIDSKGNQRKGLRTTIANATVPLVWALLW